MREIPAIVIQKKVLKFSNFRWGYLPCNVSDNEQTDLHALNNFLSSIDKVSFKKNQHVSRPCSFGGEVVHADADAAE